MQKGWNNQQQLKFPRAMARSRSRLVSRITKHIFLGKKERKREISSNEKKSMIFNIILPIIHLHVNAYHYITLKCRSQYIETSSNLH